ARRVRCVLRHGAGVRLVVVLFRRSPRGQGATCSQQARLPPVSRVELRALSDVSRGCNRRDRRRARDWFWWRSSSSARRSMAACYGSNGGDGFADDDRGNSRKAAFLAFLASFLVPHCLVAAAILLLPLVALPLVPHFFVIALAIFAVLQVALSRNESK